MSKVEGSKREILSGSIRRMLGLFETRGRVFRLIAHNHLISSGMPSKEADEILMRALEMMGKVQPSK